MSLSALYSIMFDIGQKYRNGEYTVDDVNREWAILFRHGGIANFYFFVKEVLSAAMNNDGQDINKRIHSQFTEACTRKPFGKNKVLILAPRGSLKSTVVTEGYPMWRFVNLLDQAEQEPDRQFELSGLITSHSRDNAKKFLFNIKRHFTRNQVFRDCFGDWVPQNAASPQSEESWTTESIKIVQKNIVFTLETGSVRNALEGGHYDFIIADDLHSKDNSKTRTEIEKVISYTDEIVPLGKLGAGTDFIFIGTRWAEYDAYQHLIDTWKFNEKDGNLIIFRAYNEDGSLWFPEFLTEERLQEFRTILTSYFFSAQYLNDPVPPEDQYFRPSVIEKVEIKEMPKDTDEIKYYYHGFIIVEPGGPNKGNDMTAIIVAQVNQFGQAYVVQAYAGNWDDSTIVKKVFEIAPNYHVRVVGIEEVALARRLQKDIEVRIRKGEGRFRLVPLKHRIRTKNDRIMGLEPEMINGRLFIGKWCEAYQRLHEELVKFRMDREMPHDDLVDGLAYLKEIIFPCREEPNEEKPWDHLKEKRETYLDWLGFENEFNPPTYEREMVWS